MENDATVDRFETARELVRMARGSLTIDELTKVVRRLYIMDAMEESDYKQTECARLLGAHRNTLQRWLHELDIHQEWRRVKKARNGKAGNGALQRSPKSPY